MTAPFAADAHAPAELLRAALGEDPARPLITFYDDRSGERVELSVKTFDNWVAKTANLLQDELNAAPEDRAALLLPAHWQSAVWLLACWSVGVTAVPAGDPAEAQLVVSGPDGLAAAEACGGERVALALRPLGGRFPQRPEGSWTTRPRCRARATGSPRTPRWSPTRRRWRAPWTGCR